MLCLGLHDLLIHCRTLLLKLLLLLFFALFCYAVLLGQLAELDLVKGHVPVNLLLIFKFLITGVISNDKCSYVVLVDALKALLLNEGPGKLLLLSLGQVLRLFALLVHVD